MVFHVSEGYLKSNDCFPRTHKFYSLASRLPMDLQMILCNRVFGLGDSTIKAVHVEKGFKLVIKAKDW